MNRKPLPCPLCGHESVYHEESLTVFCPNCRVIANVDSWEDRLEDPHPMVCLDIIRRTGIMYNEEYEIYKKRWELLRKGN